MLRRVIKTQVEMTTTFLTEQNKSNIASLIPGSASNLYATPTSKCVEALSVISKNDPGVSSFLAKFVTLWVQEGKRNPNVNAIIVASLLTHTAWNIMGILHKLFEICNYYSIRWRKTIMQKTLISTIVVIWLEIIKFCHEHQKKDPED